MRETYDRYENGIIDFQIMETHVNMLNKEIEKVRNLIEVLRYPAYQSDWDDN